MNGLMRAGYKEFSSYFTECDSGKLQDLAEQERLFELGFEQMKLRTRQYARRQVKWIRTQLLPAMYKSSEASEDHGKNAMICLLDASSDSLLPTY